MATLLTLYFSSFPCKDRSRVCAAWPSVFEKVTGNSEESRFVYQFSLQCSMEFVSISRIDVYLVFVKQQMSEVRWKTNRYHINLFDFIRQNPFNMANVPMQNAECECFDVSSRRDKNRHRTTKWIYVQFVCDPFAFWTSTKIFQWTANKRILFPPCMLAVAVKLSPCK